MIKLFRNIPNFKGKGKIARYLIGNSIYRKKDITISGKHGCEYILPNIIENIGFEIYVNGQYEPETINLISSLLPINGNFIDIGANIGSIVIPICKQRIDINAMAVEASPWIFNYLRSNVEINKITNLKIINNVLLNKDNEILEFFAPKDKFGKGSLISVFTAESEKIISKTLDSLVREFSISPIDVIKVDVEGYEYFVFKGAEKILKSNKAPYIIFEFVDWAEQIAPGTNVGDAQDLLLTLGYKLFAIDKRNKTEITQSIKAGTFNILAVPPNRIKEFKEM